MLLFWQIILSRVAFPMIPTDNIRHESTVLMHLKAVVVLILLACRHLGTDDVCVSVAEEELLEWDWWCFLSCSCFSLRLDFPFSARDEALFRVSCTKCGFLSEDSKRWSIAAPWGTSVVRKSGMLAIISSSIWDESEDAFLSEAAGLTKRDHQTTRSRILKLLVESISLNAQSILKPVICLLNLTPFTS